MELTILQQKSAVHYSILHLRKEIEEIKNSIETEKDPTLKKLLNSRLEELESDSMLFEKINEEWA